MSLSVLGHRKLAAAADDKCLLRLLNVACTTCVWYLHSVVDFVCHCPGMEDMLLSCHDQSHGARSDVDFIKPLIIAVHFCNF